MLHEDPTRGGVRFPQSFLEFVDCRIAPVSVRLAMVDEPTMISMPLPHETGSGLGNNPLDERTPWEVLDDLLE